MISTPAGIARSFNCEHPLNALPSIVIKLFGQAISLSDVHEENTSLFICIILSGKSILSKLEQLLKAPPPILVTPAGSSILTKLPHPAKALLPICSILSDKSTLTRFEQPLKILEGISVTCARI